MSNKFNKQLLAFFLGSATLAPGVINCLAIDEKNQPTGQNVGLSRFDGGGRVVQRQALKLVIIKDGKEITPRAPAVSPIAAPPTGGEEPPVSPSLGTARSSPALSSSGSTEGFGRARSAPAPDTWELRSSVQDSSLSFGSSVPRATATVFQSPPDMLDARLASLRLKERCAFPLTSEDIAEIEAIEWVQRSCRGNRMATLVYGATNERKECCGLLCHCIVGAGNVTTRLLDLIARNRKLQDADIAPFVQTINGQKYVYLDLHGLPKDGAVEVALCAVQYCLANRVTLDLVLGSSHQNEDRSHQGLSSMIVEVISKKLNKNPDTWITPSGSTVRYDIAGFGAFLLPISAAAAGFDSLESESAQRERRRHEEARVEARRECDLYRRDLNSLVAQLAEQQGMVRTAQAETARAIQEEQRAQERAARAEHSLESESKERRRRERALMEEAQRELDSYRRDLNSLVKQLEEQQGVVRTAQAETARAIQEKQRAQERAAHAENGIQRKIIDMKRYSDQSLHAAAQRAQEELTRVRREFEERETLIRQEAQKKEQDKKRCDVAAWLLGLLNCNEPPRNFDGFTQTIRIALDRNRQLQELFKTDSNFLSTMVSQWNTLVNLQLKSNRLWNTEQADMICEIFGDFLVRCLA